MPLSTITGRGGAAWSPDGGRIAFVQSSPSNPANISVMNADGSNAVNLTNMTFFGADSTDPVWSPDGTKIAFVSAKAFDGSNNVDASPFPVFNVWVMNADGSGQTPLSKETAFGQDRGNPAWSPDSSKIAFDGIVVMKPDGTGATTLLPGTDPQWSPDGTTIAFESSLDPNGSGFSTSSLNVWVMKADGTAAGPLTKMTVANHPPVDFSLSSLEPRWSPDGTTLVFIWLGALDGSNALNNAFNIWTVKGDGLPATPLTRLTATGSNSRAAVWSANGKQIAFTSDRALDGSNAATCVLQAGITGCPSNIWVMNADGSNPTPLTKSTSFFFLPKELDPVQNEAPRWHP